MSPHASRVVPQLGQQQGFSDLGQDYAPSFDQDEVVYLGVGRGQMHFPAAKAWMSEPLPQQLPELPEEEEDDDELPAPAKIHYYRQRIQDTETSVLPAWLQGLLCITTRTSSGRFGNAVGRESSVDSVDFVSTWQKAQAEAAMRTVVPVLKRPNEVCSMPNTPESPIRRSSPSSCQGSRRTFASASRLESRNGRQISFAGQRSSSACGMAPTSDLVQYLDEMDQRESIRGCGRQDSALENRLDCRMDSRLADRVDSRLEGPLDSRDEARVCSRNVSRVGSQDSSRPASKRSVRFN